MLQLGIINASAELPDYYKVIRELHPISFTGQYISSGQPLHHDQFPEGIRHYHDFDQFMADCDAVIIPQTKNAVYPLIVKVLKQSKHVLLGNPLLLDPDEMDHLFNLAEEANVVIKVIQNVKYYAVLKTASNYIKNPAYIEVRIDSADHQRSIFDSIFNAIQPVVFINYSNLKKLHAVSIPMNAHMPGMINARIEFENGCVANITSSKFSDTDRFYCRIHQSNQHIQVDFLEQKVTVIGGDTDLEIKKNNFLRDELDQFARSIQSRNPLINQSESGYITYLISRKIMEKIHFATLSA
jgi:predicted dehydrogenase